MALLFLRPMKKEVENNKKLRSIVLLFVLVIIFIFPFLLGMVFSLLTSMGITPIWTASEQTVSFFEVLFDPIYFFQLIKTFIRAQCIVLITLFFIFLFGYLLSSNYNNAFIQWIMYFLSIPHVSLATGFAFLIMPSGIIFRILAFFKGESTVGSITTVYDSYGISMSIVVIIKLITFLLFILVAVLQEYNLQHHVLQSKLLRHNKLRTWMFVIIPQILPKLFVPTLISVSYALAPVDISMILGPKNPSSYGVIIQELLSQYSQKKYITANILCVGLCFVSFISLVIWYALFKVFHFMLHKNYVNASKVAVHDTVANYLSVSAFIVFSCVIVFSTALLFLWCWIIRWDFPLIIPNVFGIDRQFSFFFRFFNSVVSTVCLAFYSTVLSTIFAVILLELLNYLRWRFQFPILTLIMFPLLMPTIVYITGMHIFFLYININGSYFVLLWGHTLRIVPYIVFLLYGTFKTYNNYYMIQARVLGKKYWLAFFRVKLPMIITPISHAMLIGMLVSIAEYVTTQFIGEGRWETITQLVVALYSGANRQVISILGILLMILNGTILLVGHYTSHLQKGMRKVSL